MSPSSWPSSSIGRRSTSRRLGRGLDPALFFPARGEGRPFAALAYCEACSVRSQCLAAALEVPSTGVWGGTTGLERRGLRRWAVA